MGTVKVGIEVGDPMGRRFEEAEVMVATYSQVPREVLERMGVPVWEQVQPAGSDGRWNTPGWPWTRCATGWCR